MEYRYLGCSGLQVSAMGMGGNMFGRDVDEAGTARVIHAALDIGVNFLDCADVYVRGTAEEYLGKALKGRRQQAVLATKGFGSMGEGPNMGGASRQHLIEAVDASLQRLDTDYIDLYYLHRWDSNTPMEETLRVLDDCVRAGKIRYIGSSNYQSWQIAEAVWQARVNHFAPIVCNQPQYNLLDRTIEDEIMPACAAYGVGTTPYYPLAAGFLTGKYRRGSAPPEDSRAGRNPSMLRRYDDGRNWTMLEQLEEFATKRGHTLAELAIAWVAAQPTISTVIVGATKPEQVEANAKALEWKLTPEELKEVDEISSI